MEEQIGLWWHKIASTAANSRHPEFAAHLQQQNKELGIFFRALGGAAGVSLDAAGSRKNRSRRTLLERLAGSLTREDHVYLDDESLRLAATLDFYPEKNLNQEHYFWLTALAAAFESSKEAWAEQGAKAQWILANQEASLRVLESCKGLKNSYQRLVTAELQRRNKQQDPSEASATEKLIRRALSEPGSVAVSELQSLEEQQAHHAHHTHHVPLWLELNQLIKAGRRNENEDQKVTQGGTSQQDKKRRKANDAGKAPSKGGLLIFRPESIFSWTEFAKVEHETDENTDEDLSRAADDMDAVDLVRDNKSTAKKLQMKLDRGVEEADTKAVQTNCLRMPEWNYKKAQLMINHCAVYEERKEEKRDAELPEHLVSQKRQLQRMFSALMPERKKMRMQKNGSSIDLDACIEHRCNPDQQRENFYQEERRHHRDLACLLLCDFSLSTDAALDANQRVIDVLRDSLLLFSESLAVTRDRFSIYGFCSKTRSRVNVTELKGFAERYSGQTRQRILDARPSHYTRMGAAIRFASQKLKAETNRGKLLLILSDGKPNDADYYEGRYGIEDTREAIHEARRMGLHPFCITIDNEADDYLTHMFGKSGFAIVKRPRELSRKLSQIYASLTRSGGM